MIDLSGNLSVVTAANLLLAADGRFPAGGYAHSSGLEQAVATERVHDEYSLQRFLSGSLATTARTSACFAAAACAAWRICDPTDPLARVLRDESLAKLVREESARVPAKALREASRAQGRQFLRAANATWPEAEIPGASIVPEGPHLSTAQGIVGAAIGLDPRGAALISAYSAVTGPAAAAVKLLGLDPLSVNRVIAGLAERIAEVVDEAGDLALCLPTDLPARAAPLIEIGSAFQAVRQPRMFAS
jgi:urease accessory protein